jgi:hypothetical protein
LRNRLSSVVSVATSRPSSPCETVHGLQPCGPAGSLLASGVSPQTYQSPFPRSSSQGAPEALLYSVLRRASSTRGAAICLAPGCAGGWRWGAPGDTLPRHSHNNAVCFPTLRWLAYLEAGIDDAVAQGSDPLLDNEPELARTLAASDIQRLACGERVGQQVRRIGSGLGYVSERPALTGPRCARGNGFSRHAQVPAHRRDPLEPTH